MNITSIENEPSIEQRFHLLPLSLKKLAALTALGLSGRELEQHLKYKAATINKYRTRLFDKTGFSSSLALAVYIVRHPKVEKMLREALNG